MTLASLDLTGRVAVVVGGTSGLGRAIAVGLAEAGADVVAASRRREEVEATAAEIEARGRRTLRQPCDVGDRASLEALLAACVAGLGPVDALVYAAGRTMRVPTLAMAESDWNAILDTNLTGALRTCQVFGRHMIDRGYGRVVTIASLASSVAFHEVAAYGASKAALVALTKSLAEEWAPHGVCVNAIAPGVFPTALNARLINDTPRGRELLARTPMRRFGKVEELAGAAAFLCSEAAQFVTGAVLPVDGGFLASGVNQ
jgi:NAD(P)-dependent dehydrogenase (short-subunit alcohol dehydrogenase family)